MFQRLLICTNLADGLQRFVHFAPSLYAANIQHITFLHCVPLNETGSIPRVNTEKVERAKTVLAPTQTTIPAGMTVEVKVESGRPTDIIARVAKDQKADLLVLGYSLRNALTEKLFGSTGAELYNRILIPILSVRPQLISAYTSEELDLRCRHLFRYLLLPYDGTEAAKNLVTQIKQRAQQPGSTLEGCRVVWVIDDCDRRNIPREPFVQAAQAELATVKADLASLNLQVVTTTRVGMPVLQLLEETMEADVSAIAVCHNPRKSFVQRSIPSFTQDLLRHSWHPVLHFPFGR